MLKRGYYPTKGGHLARVDEDITTIGLGVIPAIEALVAYKADGTFAYKGGDYDPHPGDSLDLPVEQWQPHPRDGGTKR